MQKPLYGLRESPLRWYIHLCGALRKFGYRQFRTDICIFAQYKENELEACILAYFGDLLFGYRLGRIKVDSPKTTDTYKTSETDEFVLLNSLQFLGADLSLRGAGAISLSLNTPLVARNSANCLMSSKQRSHFR